jgi:hypothetical protein
MLLELEDFLQDVVGALEDLFHGLVPVTILEALAAAARTDIVASHACEVQALRPPEWRPKRRTRAGVS